MLSRKTCNLLLHTVFSSALLLSGFALAAMPIASNKDKDHSAPKFPAADLHAIRGHTTARPSSANSLLWAELAHCQDDEGGQSAKTPAFLIECLSDRFLTLLKKSKVDQSLQLEVVDHGLEISNKYFDFSRMTALAFGRNWAKLSAEEKRKLVEEFRGLLFQNYSSGLSRFLGYKSSVVSSDTNDRQSIVRTSVSDGQPDHVTRVDYYLLRIRGKWMIYDVSVAGISLISSYRQQLETIYMSKGFNGVMAFLRQIKKDGSNHVVS